MKKLTWLNAWKIPTLKLEFGLQFPQKEMCYEFLEGNQNSEMYLELLQKQLPLMDLSSNFFQQDGAPIQRANKEVKFLKSNYHHHWIGQKSGEKEWSPRSPDLSPLDFFFWSYVQSRLLEYSLETKTDLLNTLKLEIPRVPKIMIVKSCSSLSNRCKECIFQNGGQIHGRVEEEIK